MTVDDPEPGDVYDDPGARLGMYARQHLVSQIVGGRVVHLTLKRHQQQAPEIDDWNYVILELHRSFNLRNRVTNVPQNIIATIIRGEHIDTCLMLTEEAQ